MKGLVLLVLMSGAPGMSPAAVASSAGSPVEISPAAASVAADGAADRLPYRDRSDEELTALAADWDSLDRHQRRALLTELKLRMARNGEREEVLHIRTERRYGRIIRQADGRVIRIETKVVQVRPVDSEDLEARQSFGVGFEHRVGRRDEAAASQPPADEATGDGAAAAPAFEPAAVPPFEEGGANAVPQPSLESVLEGLAPSTRAPEVDRLPMYQVSDPES